MKGFIVALSSIIAVVFTLIPAPAPAVPESMRLFGSGDARYLGFIKVYNAELYVQNAGETDHILSPDVSKCLKLTYEVALKPEDFVKGATLVLNRQQSSEQLGLIGPDIEKLHDAYVGVEKGDSYLLCYDAATSRTTLSLNGKELVSVQSRQFGESYFSIWLAPEQPLSSSLQKELLGAAAQGKREVRING